MMNTIYGLVWRELRADRLRLLLSLLAVALGVAATITASIVVESVRKALLVSDEMQTMMGGLIAQLDPMLGFVGMAIAGASAFLIYNAFAMSITRRRQQLGSLRALGLTRRQMIRLVLLEALLLAVTGTALGLLLAPLLGRLTMALMGQFGGGLLAFDETGPAGWSVALSIVLGLGLTLLAALIPARQAARMNPLEALRQPEASAITHSPAWMHWTGLLLGGSIMAYLLIAPPGEWAVYPQDQDITIALLLLWLVALALLLPAGIGRAGWLAQHLLAGRGTAARLAADNLRRGRGRVTLTVLTLAFALAVVTGLSGFMDFFIDKLLTASMTASAERQALFLSRIDVSAGWALFPQLNLDTVLLSADEVAAIEAVSAGRADGAAVYFTTPPELSSLGSAYFSFIMEPHVLRLMESTLFTFVDGDWSTVMPMLDTGCGVIASPLVAAKNGVSVGESFSVTGSSGPVTCTLAATAQTFAGATLVSGTAADSFGVTDPMVYFVTPHLDADAAQLTADMEAMAATFPSLVVIRMTYYVEVLGQVVGIITNTMNALLIMALLVAALSVVNTAYVSISERRREIGLLRAVGATRQQARAVILGETALVGLTGGVFGLVAGCGMVIIIVVAYGGNSWGVVDLPLWPTALASLRPALINGLVGLVVAPLIAALAAWIPARPVLRQPPVTALATELS